MIGPLLQNQATGTAQKNDWLGPIKIPDGKLQERFGML
jgi:hypothetical protein